MFLARSLRRAYCSARSARLRGADALLTPRERDARKTAPQNDAATLRIKQAQKVRQRQLADLYDIEAPAGSGSGGAVSASHLDAKLAAMERAGEFDNLKGVGKPLPERVRTHFGDEDSADRMITRIMYENNVKPESVELRARYRSRLKAFRARLLQVMPASSSAAAAAATTMDARTRASLAHEMSELQKLQAAHKSAAVKDSLTYNMPINPLPTLASTLDEELASARRARAKDT